ncbi:hypothetical protein RHO15_03915 [Utexia brackfieldae]|uniref:hypothetical protein n=1 Tax=Utexia brackfieldae TaxID=3074108 RepID=UPI00370D4145
MSSKVVFFIIMMTPYAYCQNALIMPTWHRDPFQTKQTESCQQLKNHYLSQIKPWFWSGFIRASAPLAKQNSHRPFQLWLVNGELWLAISAEKSQLFDSLWTLIEIQRHKLIWQHVLPDYCASPMIYSMQFGGEQ